MGYDASKGERNLKCWAKRLSKTARKCGQAIFIQQTARRLSDYLILQRARQILHDVVREPPAMAKDPRIVHTNITSSTWGFTRRAPHLTYNLGSKVASTTGGGNIQSGNINSSKLITEHVHKYLSSNHPNVSAIDIWKEIRINLEGGQGHHNVRSYHDYDSYGQFYDWVHVKCSDDKNTYRPAKVLLLYQTTTDTTEDFALVWQSNPPSTSDRRHETNISARWSMETSTRTRLPVLRSVPISSIERCIRVQEHWACKKDNHIPTTQCQHAFFIDEVYDRYSWALNFLDDERWNVDS